jgi:membrane protease YdiL (CAAX protease family)
MLFTSREIKYILTRNPFITAFFLFVALMCVAGLLVAMLGTGIAKRESWQVVDLGLPPAVEAIWNVIIGPVLEEVAFRAIPITTALFYTAKLSERKQNSIVLFVCIASSIVFGAAHGSWFNILVQGSLGFVLARIFLWNALKEQNRDMKAKFFAGLRGSAVVHILYNAYGFALAQAIMPFTK